MRKSKIVCTLGPATNTYDKILQLAQAGMDVCRINRSHGSPEEHERVISLVRRAAKETGRSIAILVDLQGPKVRLGVFKEGRVELKSGQEFTITVNDVVGDSRRVSTTFKGLPGDCSPGDVLLIDDGNVQVKVIDVTETDVRTRVEVPGFVSDHKGLNLPGVAVSVPALSQKDRSDLRWAIEQDADFIALSFVRRADDVTDVHAIMDEKGKRIPVIAKIEKPQAVENLVEIVEAFDGVMVARGDLGVEMPLESVPLVQKRAIELARRRAKPVIVATQVLESMITNPRPTRAEASDCANAILDGADAVMLSGETSVGAYPVEAVRTMARICESTEEMGGERIAPLTSFYKTIPGVICKAALDMGDMINAKYVVAFTASGTTARRLSRLRSTIPMLACTPSEKIRNRMSLVWGIQTYLVAEAKTTECMVQQVEQLIKEQHLAEDGDMILMVSGMPPGVTGNTNSIRIHRVGEPLGL